MSFDTTRRSDPFIPLLAEEGDKLNIGGEGQRGGLLLAEAEDENGLQNVANCGGHSSEPSSDSRCLDMLKRIRQSDLFNKEDIREYDLLYISCQQTSKERFEYLVDWDPEALKEYQHKGEQFLHANTGEYLAMSLKAGLRYYPEELGFLFKKNNDDKAGYEWHSNKLTKTWRGESSLRNVLKRLTMKRW